MRPIALLLAVALLASGCVTKKIKKALAKETAASLSVTGADPVVVESLLVELTTLHNVGANVETIEKGVQILKIVGAYAQVVEAIQWLILQNLRLIANDEVTKAILAAALK